jgi:hypothetical protein
MHFSNLVLIRVIRGFSFSRGRDAHATHDFAVGDPLQPPALPVRLARCRGIFLI